MDLGLSQESMLIVGLLHDIDKMDKYEKYYKNVQKYHPDGKKSDENGRFDWAKEWNYKLKEDNNRFVFGHHGQNSEYIVNSYIPLTIEESAAIVNHMSNSIDEYKPFDINAIYNKYPLAAALHAADYICTFLVDDKGYE